MAAIRIMRLLLEVNRPLGVSEIARSLELNKSTVHGIINTLASEHFLSEVEDSRRFQLGTALVELAEAVRGPHIAVARPFIETFAADSGLPGFIAAPYANEFLILHRAEGSGSGYRVTLPVGERIPLTAGAIGKAYLAWQPEHAAQEIIARVGLPGRTRTSITERSEFLAHLKVVRSRGYGDSREEYQSGVNALAAPVFNSAGKVVLLLTAAGLAQELPATKMRAQGARLAEVSRQVTQALGGSRPH